MKMKRAIGLLLCALLILSMLPKTPLTATAAYDAQGTTYVRVNSLEDIVPNARYIVVGEYAVEGAETDYFAMSNDKNTYDDYRVGLTALTYTDETKPNFVMAEDKQSLVLHSGSIMQVRLRPYRYGSHQDLYRMEVDGGYLYGFCNSYSYYGTSCCRELAVQQYSRGKYFWHFRMGGNGYWQISTYLDSSSSDMVSLAFNEVYADFMSYLYADNVRLDGEEYFFNTYINTDRETNIWLFREVCAHKTEDVTHVAAKAPDCTQPGNPEYWFCAGCEKYFSAADFTATITAADTLLPPQPHTDACGHESKTARFEVYKDSSMSSDQAGEYYLLIGKAGEKYYAMGNETNPDGSRNAVEVTANANGIITAASDRAEFLEYYWPEDGSIGFLADGCYFSAMDGKIVAYDKALEGSNGYIPGPAYFRIDDWDTYAGAFYAYASLDPEGNYIVFDPETLRFKAQATREDTTYLYRQLCEHENIQYCAADAATCTEQGVAEYWYCDDCYRYYDDSTLERPLEIYGPEEFCRPAFGHNYVDGVCTTCGMPRTYIPVTSLEQFDALNGATTYIIVIKDGEKTYAAALPKNPLEIDKNANGMPDIAESDEDGNGIADCIEDQIDAWGGADADEDGITTAEEYRQYIGDNNDDGVIDEQDIKRFFEMDVYWNLYYQYDEQIQQSPNFLEVTVNEDGSVTVTNDDAMEFQMVAGGVWGGQEAWEGEKEEYGILDTDRLRAAWIPNYWIGYSGQMGSWGTDHFGKQERRYGDGICPGMMDHKNWKISFRPDGTACLVNTWADFDDTGCVQFAKYVDEEGNPAMTLVGLTEDLWADSPVMSTRTELLPVYLYAAEPEDIHVCQFGEWTEVAENTYVRQCECGATEQMVLDSDDSINVTPEDTVIHTTLTDPDIQLIDRVLTDVEQSQVAQGASVQIYLTVEDISETVTEEDKQAARENAGDNQIAMYLDIELFKKVNTRQTQVTETSDAVTITLEIPEQLRNKDMTLQRTFRIIRIHTLPDGTVITDVLDGQLNPEDNTFSFETDKFSTYVLVYEDTKALIGDANNDGVVDFLDLGAMQAFLSGKVTSLAGNGDANCDGKVDFLDLGALQAYLSGKVSTLG